MSEVSEAVIAMMATEIVKLRETLLVNASQASNDLSREESQADPVSVSSYSVACRRVAAGSPGSIN